MAELQIPRGLTITAEGDRLHHEQQLLRYRFPGFELVRTDTTGRFAVRGVLTTKLNPYAIRIELPEKYPYQLPMIFPVGWEAEGPHMYKNGSICVMHPKQWRNAYSIALLVAKSAIWVSKFDIFRQDGHWPGNEQFHERVLSQSIKKWWRHQ